MGRKFKYSEKERDFRKELKRRVDVCRGKYPNDVHDTWGGIRETIEKQKPYLNEKLED